MQVDIVSNKKSKNVLLPSFDKVSRPKSKKNCTHLTNMEKQQEYYYWTDKADKVYVGLSNQKGVLPILLSDKSAILLYVCPCKKDLVRTDILVFDLFVYVKASQKSIIVNPKGDLDKQRKNQYPLPIDLALQMTKKQMEHYFAIIQQEDRFQTRPSASPSEIPILVMGGAHSIVQKLRAVGINHVYLLQK